MKGVSTKSYQTMIRKRDESYSKGVDSKKDAHDRTREIESYECDDSWEKLTVDGWI